MNFSPHRNVLKATIEVPQVGEVNFHCTQLDHLDENWRMKQINSIIQSNDEPHILVGGLNSLDETDYSSERWTDIVKVKCKTVFIILNLSHNNAKGTEIECMPCSTTRKWESQLQRLK